MNHPGIGGGSNPCEDGVINKTRKYCPELREQLKGLERWNYDTEFEPVRRILDRSAGENAEAVYQIAVKDISEKQIR